jgi:hypothetical protein
MCQPNCSVTWLNTAYNGKIDQKIWLMKWHDRRNVTQCRRNISGPDLIANGRDCNANHGVTLYNERRLCSVTYGRTCRYTNLLLITSPGVSTGLGVGLSVCLSVCLLSYTHIYIHTHARMLGKNKNTAVYVSFGIVTAGTMKRPTGVDAV